MGCHFLLQRIFPTQASSPHLLQSPALADGRSFTTSATWEAFFSNRKILITILCVLHTPEIMKPPFSSFSNVPILKSFTSLNMLWLLWAPCEFSPHCKESSEFFPTRQSPMGLSQCYPWKIKLIIMFLKATWLGVTDGGMWVLPRQIQVWPRVPSTSASTVTFVPSSASPLSTVFGKLIAPEIASDSALHQIPSFKRAVLSMQKICSLPWLALLLQCLTGQKMKGTKQR